MAEQEHTSSRCPYPTQLFSALPCFPSWYRFSGFSTNANKTLYLDPKFKNVFQRCSQKSKQTNNNNLTFIFQRASISLREHSLGHSGRVGGGGGGEGGRAYNEVSRIWIPPPIPCGSPLTELSDFCQLAWSGNEHECKQTLKKHMQRLMMSLLMSSPPIIISHRLFQCRYSNPWDAVEKLSFLFLPRRQSAPEARYSCYRH